MKDSSRNEQREPGAASAWSLATREFEHHRDQFVAVKSVPSSEFDQFLHLRHDGAAIWSIRDANGAASSHLNDALVAQHAQRAKDGVRIDAQLYREVSRLRYPLARTRLTLCDRPSNLSGHLFVKQHGITPVQSREG